MPVLRADIRPGVVYTPPEVAAPMVRVALEPLLRGRTSEQLLALRVCDPAIGEGAFLVEVVNVLAEAVLAAWRAEGIASAGDDPSAAARQAVTRCIAGIDIDAHAVATARSALGCDAGTLRIGDALELDWRAAFAEVFAHGGFDAVVGNPPYIRQERLGAHKPALHEFASYDGVADLYVYFVELAHRILRPGGRYCLITPNKWLTAAYGRGLRGFLARQGSVEGVVDLARVPLFAAADAFPCIVWGTGGEPACGPIRAARVASGTVAEALRDAGVPHPRERWRSEPWHIDATADRALIDRLERTWPALGDVLGERPARGVVTGCNRAFVIDRATRDRLMTAVPTAGDLVRPFVKGRDVKRWQPDPVERWILLVDRGTSLAEHPAIAAHLAQFRTALEPRPPDHRGAWGGRKPGTYRWYELQDPVGALAASRAPRLLYQDIQTGPACALDRSGELVPDTTVWILPSADLYLLAVLNSSLYGWYAQRRFPPALNGSVRPKLEYLRALPIATPSPASRSSITKLVEERLALEPHRRAGGEGSAHDARELDAAIDASIIDVYGVTSAERGLLRQ
jgi:SAM-dependent methyltransferase